jgi:hypothetical protein
MSRFLTVVEKKNVLMRVQNDPEWKRNENNITFYFYLWSTGENLFLC